MLLFEYIVMNYSIQKTNQFNQQTSIPSQELFDSPDLSPSNNLAPKHREQNSKNPVSPVDFYNTERYNPYLSRPKYKTPEPWGLALELTPIEESPKKKKRKKMNSSEFKTFLENYILFNSPDLNTAQSFFVLSLFQ